MEDLLNNTDIVDSNSDISDNSTQEPTTPADNSAQEPHNDNVDINNESDLILGKFKTQADLEKSYQELSSQFAKNSTELGELRKFKEQYSAAENRQKEFVKNLGFDSVEKFDEYVQSQKETSEFAEIEANIYSQFLAECEYPEEVKNLLIEYSKNPSKELLSTIRNEFSSDTLYKIAENLGDVKRQLAINKQQAAKEQDLELSRTYLNKVIPENMDYFSNNSFKTVFAEAFKMYGRNTDVNEVKKIYDTLKKDIIAELKTSSANDNDINKISDLDGGSVDTNSSPSVNFDEMTSEEIDNYVKKHISKTR